MDEYKNNTKDYAPCMHSAEHILNQTMVRIFNCGRAFNAHIERKKSKCDYHFNRNITLEEIKLIENKVNDVINQKLPIIAQILDRNEAEKLVPLTRLPEDAGEKVRIITIGDYDICPCSGEHAKSTSEIGEFKIISTDFKDGTLRIRFKVRPKS